MVDQKKKIRVWRTTFLEPLFYTFPEMRSQNKRSWTWTGLILPHLISFLEIFYYLLQKILFETKYKCIPIYFIVSILQESCHLPALYNCYTDKSRFKKLHFSFPKLSVDWFKKHSYTEFNNLLVEKNVLCRWICKLRSFLNREFTVLEIRTWLSSIARSLYCRVLQKSKEWMSNIILLHIDFGHFLIVLVQNLHEVTREHI